ncbi:hypothetical protein JCGZ_09476 [Jatropha curcas]|uniref:HTH OST-type domain-containing protein n=2 Tax=Jatropha curcas TaxID=180498 RepID=A0A067KGT7_JATCU|nr:hypothetical protein JCGZ_09476 [Jatropha curcas]
MARNLLKDGPMVCRSISETDALRLVDILISEKKWVEEYPSEASPFELTLCVGKNTSSSDSHASIGLRSLSTPLQSKPKRQAEGDGDGRTIRIQNISHAGVSQPFSYKKSSERSRLETLRRCQKLVNEIMKDYPEGYNIGSFRKLFLEKYGYHLDVQKLGYGKLVSMLQIMPGVNIESNYIIPSSNVPKCSSQDSALSNIQESNTIHTSVTSGSEMSNASKDAESNSTWEEPDPVENADSSRKESEGKCTFPQYVSSSSDDDSSDSEREPLSYDSDRSTSKVWNEK